MGYLFKLYILTSYTRQYQRDGCVNLWGGMLRPLFMIICACAFLT